MITKESKGSPLTHAEMDANLNDVETRITELENAPVVSGKTLIYEETNHINIVNYDFSKSQRIIGNLFVMGKFDENNMMVVDVVIPSEADGLTDGFHFNQYITMRDQGKNTLDNGYIRFKRMGSNLTMLLYYDQTEGSCKKEFAYELFDTNYPFDNNLQDGNNN